jgi:hypothetical protein
VGIIGSYFLMVLSGMVFRDVVSKVFGPGVPDDTHVVMVHLVHDPKVAHFHGAGSLLFYGVVGDANGSGVVTMDGGGRLQVAHFFKDDADDLDFLGIEEEGPEFAMCLRTAHSV